MSPEDYETLRGYAEDIRDEHPVIADTLHRCCDDSAKHFVVELEAALLYSGLPVDYVTINRRVWAEGKYVGETWVCVKLLGLVGEKPRFLNLRWDPSSYAAPHFAFRELISEIVSDYNIPQ